MTAQRDTDSASTLRHAITSCSRRMACEIMADELERLAKGMPVAPLFGVMDEATSWASFSTIRELKAYCLACFNALPRNDQLAFLDYVQRRST